MLGAYESQSGHHFRKRYDSRESEPTVYCQEIEVLIGLVRRVNDFKDNALALQEMFDGLEFSDQFYKSHQQLGSGTVKAKQSSEILGKIVLDKAQLTKESGQIEMDFNIQDASLTEPCKLDETIKGLFEEFKVSLEEGREALNSITDERFYSLDSSFFQRTNDCCVLL